MNLKENEYYVITFLKQDIHMKMENEIRRMLDFFQKSNIMSIWKYNVRETVEYPSG